MIFPWIKRSDLIARPLDSGGWVVKDPLTLKYALLNDAEYGVLQFMDGRVTVAALLQRLQQLCPERDVSSDDLGGFTGILAQHQLIRRILPGDSQRLGTTAGHTHPLRLLQPVLGILRLHLPLVNPSRWLDRLLPGMTVLIHPIAQLIYALTAAMATIIVCTQFRQITGALPSMEEFLGPQNLLLMLVTFVAIKVLHEAGHALTARYFGAECNECGIMLMVFTPVLYTNVTDTWLLPRRQRLLVTGAGIIVELLIAAAATLLWSAAEPGLTRSMLLNVMLICSVNTLLFNGNPLLRFDGYFLLADWMGLPNLSARADTVVRNTILSVVTGKPVEYSDGSRTHRFLLLYGVLATAYRFLLTLAILQLVRDLGRQWHVEIVSGFLSAVLLGGFLVLPALRFTQELLFVAIDDESDNRHRRRMVVAGVVVLALLLVPLPSSVVSPAMVRPTSVGIYAELSGRISPRAVYGDNVAADDILAELTDDRLDLQRAQLTSRVADLRQQLDILTSSPATANSDVVPTVREALTSAELDLQGFEQESAALTIHSMTAGTFLPPPLTPPETRSDLPQRWWGTPGQGINQGAWIERGTLIGHVGSKSDLAILACVEESEIEHIRIGLTATFLPRGSGPACTGQVVEVAHLPAPQLDAQFQVAGLVSGRRGAAGLIPAVNSYLVTIQLEEKDPQAVPALYSVGHARIHVQYASISKRIVRYFRRTFS